MEFLCSFRKHHFACKPVASHVDVLGASSRVELRDEPKQRQWGRLANQRYAVALRNSRLFSMLKHEVNRARMKQPGRVVYGKRSHLGCPFQVLVLYK